MKKKNWLALLLPLIFWFIFSGSNAKTFEKHKADSTWNNWNFRISPYFWYIGFKGTIYRPPTPSNFPEPPPKYEIDVGFKDIKNSIKFALMLAGQYRNDHIIAQFNVSSLVLESEAITPLDLLLQDNIVNLTYVGGDLGIGYRVVKNPKFEFDALLGVKFVYFKIGLSTNLPGIVEINGERDRLWVDPVLGINLKYRPFRKVEFVGYADIGPSALNDIFTSQVMAGASYVFTKTFLLTIGYRYYTVEFPKSEAIFNGAIKGWIMKIGFQF